MAHVLLSFRLHRCGQVLLAQFAPPFSPALSFNVQRKTVASLDMLFLVPGSYLHALLSYWIVTGPLVQVVVSEGNTMYLLAAGNLLYIHKMQAVESNAC
jgi:hypothetical protein